MLVGAERRVRNARPITGPQAKLYPRGSDPYPLDFARLLPKSHDAPACLAWLGATSYSLYLVQLAGEMRWARLHRQIGISVGFLVVLLPGSRLAHRYLEQPMRRRRAPGGVTLRPGRGHDEAGAAAPDVRAACTMRIASPASMPTLAITAA
ncbi:hypothetical protein [Nonomuraea sp. LPB2021202275-12-8]|uniref:hypothetical protein n=1 Tax=Nonomuraea sp. LPB2021202275-12-8 TaxID=3120159 RepID=UPI00300C2F77